MSLRSVRLVLNVEGHRFARSEVRLDPLESQPGTASLTVRDCAGQVHLFLDARTPEELRNTQFKLAQLRTAISFAEEWLREARS